MVEMDEVVFEDEYDSFLAWERGTVERRTGMVEERIYRSVVSVTRRWHEEGRMTHLRGLHSSMLRIDRCREEERARAKAVLELFPPSA